MWGAYPLVGEELSTMSFLPLDCKVWVVALEKVSRYMRTVEEPFLMNRHGNDAKNWKVLRKG